MLSFGTETELESAIQTKYVSANAGLAIGNAPRETANGKGSAPPPALTPPSTDLAQPQPQQGEGREDKDGKTARKQLPDRAIYQPPAGPPDSAAEGETSASGTPYLPVAPNQAFPVVSAYLC